MRFTFILSIFASATMSLSTHSACDAAEPDKPMNVLFLVADDLNSWLLEDADRYAGKVVTPNLRKFAASGVNFTRAYTAAPVCSPSRTAFFSGVSPWHSGHYHNALQVKQSEPLKNALSLAGCFKQADYTTAGFGKITHGWDQKEHWDEKLGHKRDPAPPGAPLTPVGRGEQDWGPIHLAEADMNDTRNADATIAQLQREHDKPFFIAFGTFNPHMPWYVPQKYFDMFPMDEVTTPRLLKNDLDDVPPLGVAVTAGKRRFVDSVLEHGLHKDAVQAYLATTAYVDAQMGRVLDALDRSPHQDNTIVVFLSDHGFHLGEKHHWQKATLVGRGDSLPADVSRPRRHAHGKCEPAIRLSPGHLSDYSRIVRPGPTVLSGWSIIGSSPERSGRKMGQHGDHVPVGQEPSRTGLRHHPKRVRTLYPLRTGTGGIL